MSTSSDVATGASKFILIMASTFAVLFLMFWGVGWIVTGANVFSAGNVKDQWKEAYQANESLSAAASTVCLAEKQVQAATNDNEAVQRRSQLAAYEQNYLRIAARYNAQVRNGFEAKWVLPRDLPDQAQSLIQAKGSCL
jgi:hypothetical protein